MTKFEDRYGDLGTGPRDSTLDRFLAALERVHTAPLSSHHDQAISAAVQRASQSESRAASRTLRGGGGVRSLVAKGSLVSRRWRRARWLPLGVGAALMACFALAAGITDLGPPSNAKPPIGALGPFRHAGPVLRQNGKPELLFIGTQLDNNSAAQRWPVVKALQQFGTLSNVKPSRSRECGRDPLGRIRCYDFYSATSSSPTFDWERAHYRSQYVAFIHKDLVDLDRKMRQSLSPQELKLFNRYGLLPGDTDWRKSVWDSILNAPFQAADPLPVMLVGGYVHTSGDLASPGDLEPRNSTTALPFATIQRSLQLGKPVGGAVPSLIADYNSEANIITALICHADHARPAQVCGRPVIRQMMKHIK